MRQFSCFVVGKGAIALQCLKWLQSFEILGVYSSDRSLWAWADAQKVRHPRSLGEFECLLLSSEYDYLFSINNGWIVPATVLQQARRGTINYHNSPLPKYAGVNATTWALIHGEQEHAVSWHEVVPTIDSGRLLKQAKFPILPTDTALSLNTRCAEVAIATFAELVGELEGDRAAAVEQNLAERSYFGLHHRPAAAAVLRWTESTQTLVNLVRALDFGPTPNPIALPKLWLPGGVVAVGRAEAIASEPLPAGQVLSLDAEGLRVATADSSLQITQITTLSGQPVTAEMLRDRYGVQLGAKLPDLSEPQREAIDRQLAVCRHERTWVEHLARLAPFVHPYLQADGGDAGAVGRDSIALPSALRVPSFLLAGFAAYCARLASEPQFDLALQTDAQRGWMPLFAQSVPLRIQSEAGTFSQFRDRFDQQLRQAERLGSYAIDALARHPDLRNCPALPVAIVLADRPDQLAFESLGAAIAFVAYADGSPPELVQAGAVKPAERAAIIQQLQTLLAAVWEQPDQALHALPLLPPAALEQVLVEWNATAKPYPQRCIHELIAEQAARTPEAIAVSDQQTQLSYRDLDRLSNQLARWLAHLGVMPETRVALCLPRRVDLLVGLLGILKAGGAYVPIDPFDPADRIAYLLGDSRPQAIVTTAALREQFSVPTVCLEDAAVLASDPAPLTTRVTPANLAYIIYTSGSTGQPKGVEIEHRSLVNHA